MDTPPRYFHSPISSLLHHSGLPRAHPEPETRPETLPEELAIRIIGDEDLEEVRYDIQRAATWLEQILPFSLLLLLLFVRQHLQGLSLAVLTALFLLYSDRIVRTQTALKGGRKIPLLVAYFLMFLVQLFGVYWWCADAGLYYPLFMLPPKTIPPFWHAVFVVLINDAMVRQAGMSIKLIVLVVYRDGKSRSFCRQGRMLTMVEYTLLLYRALLPTPVWYRFFLNKEYGRLFSSLTTGLYLTFKLTSILDKVRSFFFSLRALSKKDVHYGLYATAEQLNAAGDLCAICQEKMHAPVLLKCKHIFCEDCVSEWFERERTCPLCRASVKPADIPSFGDGSTSLSCQLF